MLGSGLGRGEGEVEAENEGEVRVRVCAVCHSRTGLVPNPNPNLTRGQDLADRTMALRGGRGRVGEASFEDPAVLNHAVVRVLALAHETLR